MWKSWSNAGRVRLASACVFALILSIAAAQIPSIGAAALLQPPRSTRSVEPPPGCDTRTFDGYRIALRGWHCRARTPRRGTAVILHGVADSRASIAGVVERFARRGLDVVAYDSRAHGESGGEFCTYGYYEKHDLRAVVERLPPGPVVLIGTSLGAAVALQAAEDAPRVTGIIAAEVFSDLRSVARDRVPRFVPGWVVDRAFRHAEARAGFAADAVSPAAAARRIAVPVLLIHGASDTDTTPDHSKRVLAALAGPKRLVLVEGAGHNHSLRSAAVWTDIEAWVDRLLG